MSRAQTDHIAALQVDLEAAQRRIAELEAERAPIPCVTDGTRDTEPYTLDDVTRIEAARGKPYARLRVTVQRIADDADYVRSLRGTEERLKAQVLKLQSDVMLYKRDADAEWGASATERDALKAQVAALRDSLGLAVRMYAHRELLANHLDCGAWVNQARALLSTPNPAEGYTLVSSETLRRVRATLEFLRDMVQSALLHRVTEALALLPEVKP